jgi:hypothetical protein
MKTYNSLPHSQKPGNGLSPEPDNSSPVSLIEILILSTHGGYHKILHFKQYIPKTVKYEAALYAVLC